MSRTTKEIPESQTGITYWNSDDELDYIIRMLDIHDEAPSVYECYDKYAWSEPVRMPQHEYHNDKDVFRLVRAERALRSKPKGKK